MKHNVITWDTCSNWHVNCSGSKEVGPLLLLEPMSHDMATNKQYCSVTWHRNCSLTGRDEKIQDRDDMGYAHLSAQYTERDIYIYIYMKLRHVINSCKIMFTHVYMRSNGTISGCFDMPWGSPKAVFQPLKILLHQRVELRHILLYNIKSYNIILPYVYCCY